MFTIPKTFVISSLGRSGTMFLTTQLNRGTNFWVIHEHRKDRRRFSVGGEKTFPLERFLYLRFLRQAPWRGYGEVNSRLRHVLDPHRPGLERFVAKRGLILRNPRDVIASAMNRRDRTREDFPGLCRKVLGEYDRLLQLRHCSPLSYETFLFDRMTKDVDYLVGIAAWAGVELDRSSLSVEQRINENPIVWFPKWAQWDDGLKDIYQRTLDECVTMRDEHDLLWS